MRGFGIVLEIVRPIDVEEAQNPIDDPITLASTDVENSVSFIPADIKNGFLIQNEGPDDAFIRINGVAGTGANQKHVRLKPNTAASVTAIAVSKISTICQAAETATLNITVWERET
jgi:hypothetical protein